MKKLVSARLYRGGSTSRYLHFETDHCTFWINNKDRSLRFRFALASKGGGKTDVNLSIGKEDFPDLINGMLSTLQGELTATFSYTFEPSTQSDAPKELSSGYTSVGKKIVLQAEVFAGSSGGGWRFGSPERREIYKSRKGDFFVYESGSYLPLCTPDKMKKIIAASEVAVSDVICNFSDEMDTCFISYFMEKGDRESIEKMNGILATAQDHSELT